MIAIKGSTQGRSLSQKRRAARRYILTDGVNYYYGRGLVTFGRDAALAAQLEKPRAEALLKVWRSTMGASLTLKEVR